MHTMLYFLLLNLSRRDVPVNCGPKLSRVQGIESSTTDDRE